MQYLYQQTGRSFNTSEDQLDSQTDEGFADVDSVDEPVVAPTCIINHDEHPTTVVPPVDSDSDQEEEEVMYICSTCLAFLTTVVTCTSTFFLVIIYIQEETSEDVSGEAVDSRGIPGWEKVDRLARALLDLEGLCVTNAQAQQIKTLHSQLLDFDKQPITFQPKPVRQPKGRFARSKYRVGNSTIDAMKR